MFWELQGRILFYVAEGNFVKKNMLASVYFGEKTELAIFGVKGETGLMLRGAVFRN